LYSTTTNRDAMRKLFRVDGGWNQLHLPGIFPDKPAPIVRRKPSGEREIVAARWGMPTPPAFRKGPIDRGVTNIRNTNSPHWRVDEAGESLSCPSDQLLRANRCRRSGDGQEGLDMVRIQR
jgi:putative SOS response-associated peptidase YedK